MSVQAKHETPLIKVRGLKKYFPIHKGIISRHVGDVRAVDGLSFDVGRQETLSLVGESGCGKTTAGRSLLKLLEPTAGSAEYRPDPDAPGVNLFDLNPRAMRPYRRDLQIIFQDPFSSLNPRFHVARSSARPCASTAWPRAPSSRTASTGSSRRWACDPR